jgi:hypothetical protein
LVHQDTLSSLLVRARISPSEATQGIDRSRSKPSQLEGNAFAINGGVEGVHAVG